MTNRENFLRTVLFGDPAWIPSTVHINGAEWAAYKKDVEDVVLRHPTLFPTYYPGKVKYREMKFDLVDLNMTEVKDAWGCTWVYPIQGLDGACTGHPLEDLDALEDYVWPEPNFGVRTEEQWAAEIAAVQALKDRGEVAGASTDHGILFLRLTYLRGFDNAMFDFADGDPRLQFMIDRIVDYYMKVVRYHLRRKVDFINFAEDLGTQDSTILSPADFQKWIKPAYKKLMDPCREQGVIVGLHSDGKTLDILEDQIAAGVQIVNPQDLCNGIDELARRIKGKACIELDIDRQRVIPYGTRKDIDDLIREETMKLGSPRGGLMFVAGIYPPTPPENLDALCAALEKYRTYWWE
jgi:uroporphyrinogen decarboxylase